ncbi:MAG: SIS domain-containing protein [Bacillota bacterium]
MDTNLIQKEWDATIKAFAEFSKPDNITVIAQIAKTLADAFNRGNKAMIAGNGGSACDAIHFAEEFTGRFRKDRRALPVISFADPAHITCVGNDYGFDDIFSRDIEAFGVSGDVFIAISTSGNSPNIIKAVQAAKARGIVVVTLLGKSGGALKGIGDYELIAAGETSDKIQEVHMAVLHIIIAGVEAIMFGMK